MGPLGCVAAQLCSSSAFRNDTECAAGSDDTSLTIFNAAGTCAGTVCAQSECEKTHESPPALLCFVEVCET